jgi:hypothetical protein
MLCLLELFQEEYGHYLSYLINKYYRTRSSGHWSPIIIVVTELEDFFKLYLHRLPQDKRVKVCELL